MALEYDLVLQGALKLPENKVGRPKKQITSQVNQPPIDIFLSTRVKVAVNKAASNEPMEEDEPKDS